MPSAPWVGMLFDPLDVFGRHRNLAAKTAVHANVFQIRRRFRGAVQLHLDALPIGVIVVSALLLGGKAARKKRREMGPSVLARAEA